MSPSGGSRARTSMVARAAAIGALTLAIVVVTLLVLGGGATYRVNALFQDASGLVRGDEVLIGPARVGSVTGVGLGSGGQAIITMSLASGASPLHRGTTAYIRENSLSGIANRYVELYPGPLDAPHIPDGGIVPADRTYSTVNLDQLFNAFDPLTRVGLSRFIRGEAASLQGMGLAANKSLLYLAPALSSTSTVTHQLARDEPAFDALLVQGAATMQTLASRAGALSQLVGSTATTTGALNAQAVALKHTISALPATLAQATQTFGGLRTTLDVLDPLVAASKPATVKLAPFAAALGNLARASVPTVGQLSTLIHNPAGTGDLTTLLNAAPALADASQSAFPRAITTMNRSQAQLDSLREYTPDIAAALGNLGQASAYYDANGHYTRAQPDFFAFPQNALTNLLVSVPNFNRLTNVGTVQGRCPGGAMQPSPDGSAPWAVPGCSLSAVPPY